MPSNKFNIGQVLTSGNYRTKIISIDKETGAYELIPLVKQANQEFVGDEFVKTFLSFKLTEKHFKPEYMGK